MKYIAEEDILERFEKITFGFRMEKAKLNVTHVIFDLDGLLLDSEGIYTDVNNKVMEKWGKKFTLDLKPLTMGRSHKEAIELMIEKASLLISSVILFQIVTSTFSLAVLGLNA